MPDPAKIGTSANQKEAEQITRQLFEWVDSYAEEPWKQVGISSEGTERVAGALLEIAGIPVVQGDTETFVPFVYRSNVVNLRPLVIPALVAAVVKIAVTVAPSMESPILPWLDLLAVLEKTGEIYRHLDDDEVDVFGVVSVLWTRSQVAPSVTDPSLYPTAEGVRQWFEDRGLHSPSNLHAILESLKEKGALLTKGSFYEPSFLGK
jgi:hypothetical protein